MKKSTKLMVALLVIVAALAVTYRLMNRVPSADLEANAQMQQIITDAGCLRCHTSNPDLPFYANMPVAGKIVMEDVSKAYRAFDMTRMAADLKAGGFGKSRKSDSGWQDASAQILFGALGSFHQRYEKGIGS